MDRLTDQPLLARGNPDAEIGALELEDLVRLIAGWISMRATRVLLVPPDHTRLQSRAGVVTTLLRSELGRRGCEVAVLPAVGTHHRMTDADATLVFGGELRAADLLTHDWRSGLTSLGELDAAEVSEATQGKFASPIEVVLDEQLFAGWDLVVSIGQVVPHEVTGMANFTKNLIVGLGGVQTIHRTHFVGAVAGMERIMGRAANPVRELVDAAFDRFVAPAVALLWVLTVVEDIGARTVLRGLFAGKGTSSESGGSAFRAAAALAQQVNIDLLDTPLTRVACWLDPLEFRSTWLGNKSVYRTRMAIADGGELLVLAPGVTRFGEDDAIDVLIRRFGYRGTPATLAAVVERSELAASLATAAHLIHGSSEGRFRVVYCTDPERGGLTRADVERAGYGWRSLSDAMTELDVKPGEPTGSRSDRFGDDYFYVANPALGLWSTADRFTNAVEEPQSVRPGDPERTELDGD